MGHPQEGWLQLDLANGETTPVEPFPCSNQGVGVILMADLPHQQGVSAACLPWLTSTGWIHAF